MKRTNKKKAIFWQKKILTLQKKYAQDKKLLKQQYQKEIDICTRMLEQYE